MFKSLAPTRCGKIFPDDSIFVLTGDARRIPFAIKKLDEYPDTDLYVIGAGATEISDLGRRATIESQSKSTYQNALAIADIARKNGLDRIVLITTEDHMLRAKYLVRRQMPNVDIVECPAALREMSATQRLERWGIEYIKYIVTMFGIKEGPK